MIVRTDKEVREECKKYNLSEEDIEKIVRIYKEHEPDTPISKYPLDVIIDNYINKDKMPTMINVGTGEATYADGSVKKYVDIESK